MKILTNFEGANIIVSEEKENSFIIEPDMRDTDCDWFYWAFMIEGEIGESATFTFKKPVRLGRRGPAVSTDLKSWKWLGGGDDMSFSYTFGDEKRVYLSHSIPYPTTRFSNQGFDIKELCKSEKGRSVPYSVIGNGEKAVILTARHHCCEASGGYVMEGAAGYLKENLPPELKVIVVPYVDYDGVYDGDQGKNRRPHDHNRDYKNSIYSTVKAIKALTEKEKILYAFDFHAPYYQGGRRDYPFIVHSDEGEETYSFARLLEKETEHLSIKYSITNDVGYGVEWNKKSDRKDKFSSYFASRAENILAFTLETPYFGTAEHETSIDYYLELGKSFARAFLKFHERI